MVLLKCTLLSLVIQLVIEQSLYSRIHCSAGVIGAFFSVFLFCRRIRFACLLHHVSFSEIARHSRLQSVRVGLERNSAAPPLESLLQRIVSGLQVKLVQIIRSKNRLK